MRPQRFISIRLSNPHMTRSLSRLLTITFTTAAFDRSSSWLFEAFPYRTAPKDLPSSWTLIGSDSILPSTKPWTSFVMLKMAAVSEKTWFSSRIWR